MKGIELPINALIIIVVAVLVLLGIVALWMSGWGGGSQGVTIEAAKASGCAALMRDAAGCTSVDPATILYDGGTTSKSAFKFDVKSDGDTTNDNLQVLCDTYYGTSGATKASDCRKICGCGG